MTSTFTPTHSAALFQKLDALPPSPPPTARPLSPITFSPASSPSSSSGAQLSPSSTPPASSGAPSPLPLSALLPDVAAPLTPPHDPHVPPDFSAAALSTRTAPILYLPPLLSQLPPSHAPAASDYAKVTDARLPSIDGASLALHRALHGFRPREDYALKAYGEAFNWGELEVPAEVEGEWYCVCFRSVRAPGSNSGPLYAADAKAHEEAVSNGGLLMYWYGTPRADTGLNLATCVWQSRAHAIAANSRPHHIRAMRLAAKSYAMYDLERYALRTVRGETRLTVHEWEQGDGVVR